MCVAFVCVSGGADPPPPTHPPTHFKTNPHPPPHPPAQAGGNDYVCKPFGGRELVARIQAQLRIRQFAQGVPRAAPVASASQPFNRAGTSAAPPALDSSAGHAASQPCNGAGSGGELALAPGGDAGQRQGGAASPADGLSASPVHSSTQLQRQVEQLQQQLLSTQRQLVELAAAAGSPAGLAAVQPAAAAAAHPAVPNGRCSMSQDSQASCSSDSAGTGLALLQGAACACLGDGEGALCSSQPGSGVLAAELAAA